MLVVLREKPDSVCRVFLMRHCETMGNLQHVFQGQINTPISPRGKEQMELLALRCRNETFDAIYSSPLERAVKTAEAVNQYHRAPLYTHDGLIEIHGGVWEGEQIERFAETHLEDEIAWTERPWDFSPEGGESMRTVYARVWKAMQDILSREQGHVIGIVSHGCAIRNILCHALGKPIEAMNEVGWGVNTAVSVLDFWPDGTCDVLLMNDGSHVPVNPDAFTGVVKHTASDDPQKYGKAMIEQIRNNKNSCTE